MTTEMLQPETFLDGKVQLYGGDCLAILPQLPENSVDAVIIDPPYHLASIVKRFGKDGAAAAQEGTGGLFARASRGFMGKTWDGGDIAFRPDTFRAILRVLKPGGHMLAFNASKQVGRMQVAIEDAGFEMTRDVILNLIDADSRVADFIASLNDAQRGAFFKIMEEGDDAGGLLAWVFSVGFPKSHNLDKKRGDLICGCGAEPASKRDVRSMQRADLSAAFNAGEECGKVLQPGMPERSLSANGSQASAGGISAFDRSDESVVERRGDIPATQGAVWIDQVRSLSAGVSSDGAGRRLHHGASSGDGPSSGTDSESHGSRPSYGSRSAEQSTGESGTVAGQSLAQDGRAWPSCRRCGKPMVARGLGTALKPAFEAIVLARKPLIGTVAENVIAFGTGALNIDEARVPTDDDLNGGAYAEIGGRAVSGSLRAGSGMNVAGKTTGRDFVQPRGRYPANVIHDGSEAAVSAFPIDGDSSASRFFYSAKADDHDRVGSRHPTIKKVDLIQWCVRLVTAPGQIVLDCFAGTGTLGEACFREGRRALLIEREDEYRADIRRRMALCLAGPDERKRESIKAKTATAPVDAGPLFGGSDTPPGDGETNNRTDRSQKVTQ